MDAQTRPLDIAVIGTGIAGLSAAWLLSRRHRVAVYEQAERIGGHSHTVMVDSLGAKVPVDTGFIVYNEAAYPNLTALFAHLAVPTKPSDMSFAVSLDDGALEYNGTDLRGLFARRRNIVSPRFWSMLRDLVRFYRTAPTHAGTRGLTSLGDYLSQEGYGRAFVDDHLLPMAAAIWSAPARQLLDYPVEAFIRFCENHALLSLGRRPSWRTVDGGSAAYVERLTAPFRDRIGMGRGARRIVRSAGRVAVEDTAGERMMFDHAVVATHADEALALLAEPSDAERMLLGRFRYAANRAVLHRDAAFMPRRRAAWASWSYLGRRQSALEAASLCVTYWMNRLQDLPAGDPLFLTLNPPREPRAGTEIMRQVYTHPLFDAAAMTAQAQLWSLQGQGGVWFCGAYFGAGFHEDALQAGLAVAEALGGVRRPWSVEGESNRLVLPEPRPALAAAS